MKNTYTEMKDSGVEWIGDIPKHWQIVRFKRIHESSNVGISIDKEYWSTNEHDTIFYTASQKPIYTYYKNIENSILTKKDDLLLARNGTPYVYLPKNGAIYTDHIIRVDIARNYNKSFIKYCLQQSIANEVVDTVSITTWSIPVWNRQRLPIPPLPEQAAIAAYLDEKCGTIDEIIAEAKASIEEYKAWKSSVIFEAVTKGLNPNAEMKDSGVEWIGKVPRHWKMTKTKFCSSKIGSGKTPRGGAEIYTDSGVMILRSQNIYNTGLMLDNVSYISEEIDEEMANSRVFEDDILLNITGGSIGRCCIYPANFPHANVNQHVCIIRVIKDIMIPKLMLYIWMSDVGQKSIDICQTGANREGMNFEQIGNTIIPLMAYTEQQAIVNYLDEKCAAIDGIIAEKESLIADMEAYKKSLIFETVTGKRKVC